jgi:hypothetical protein
MISFPTAETLIEILIYQRHYLCSCIGAEAPSVEQSETALEGIHSFIHSQTLIVQDGPLVSLFGVS